MGGAAPARRRPRAAQVPPLRCAGTKRCSPQPHFQNPAWMPPRLPSALNLLWLRRGFMVRATWLQPQTRYSDTESRAYISLQASQMPLCTFPTMLCQYG